ncbi:aminopeptidase [uncultured Traorella sp.]|uniref:aminopeptidase n=1 Tax=uncultured Traorella sp. TaxID=1929048 RepID=UPI0025DC5FDF|nr:aminopeptidase [uncultured Traorella sp.]
MNQKIYEEYAKLAVEIGINLKEGQDVEITASTKCADFVKEIVKVCYEDKARSVKVEWLNEEIDKLRWLYEDEKVMSEVLTWQEEKAKYRAETLPCKIYVDDADPDAYNGIDLKKYAAVRKARYSVLKKYSDKEDNRNQWVIVAIPSVKWAKKVFPELSDDEAVSKLWEAIIKTMRLDQPDPVQAWKDHIDDLQEKSTKLNEMNLDYLEYKSSNGTDLTLKLQPNHYWISARETNMLGNDFTANMPTEEVFTMPKRDGVNGVVYSTKPLSLQGQLVENFKVTFKDGKCVEVSAEKGQDILENMLNMDENSRHLGEVALVPYDSPINQTGLLFSNTLFDENACCHLAFGEAFKNNIRGYENMSEEDFKKVGFNESINHVDFMVGSEDLDIVGVDHDGNRHQIFKNGVWAI